MEYQLLIAGFLLGMLIGVLIMNRIYNSHSKEMQKIDDDFEKWKVQRHKQFVDELDEIDRKSRNYVIYPEQEKGLSKEEFESKQRVTNPDTIDPTKVMDEIKKKRVFSPAETDRILSSEHVMWRHSNPELSHLTDDEIDELLKENSDSIQEDYIKAEAWDKLMHWLKFETHIVGYSKVILMKMQQIYTEVEKDYN